MFTNCIALAQRAGRPLIVFDLEHTGGAKETRGITEFAAHIVAPSGALSTYCSLVKPPDTAVFNHFASKLTGITRQTVAAAPAWSQVAGEIIKPNQDSLWVGFNSRSCDMPIILADCIAAGVDFAEPERHLDLFRVSPSKQRLSQQVAAAKPDLDIGEVHRAAKDALLTLWLLETLLPSLPEQHVLGRDAGWAPGPYTCHDAPGGGWPAYVPSKKSESDDRFPEFVTNKAFSRHGRPWLAGEAVWVCGQFKDGRALTSLATAVGRAPRGVAFVLARQGLLSAQDKIQYSIS